MARMGQPWNVRHEVVGTVTRAGFGSLVITACLLAGCGGATRASPYDRDCGTSRDGFLTRNNRWQSPGPLHVQMSAATARSIARRIGPGELQPPGSHPPAKDVPCVVASSVAGIGANSYSVHGTTDEWIDVVWASYSSGPSLGRFRCRASRRAAGRVDETCTHRPDRHAGSISVKFILRPLRAPS